MTNEQKVDAIKELAQHLKLREIESAVVELEILRRRKMREEKDAN
jgi:hypothetical protein